jgi:6-phosphogluconate dehydrogenase
MQIGFVGLGRMGGNMVAGLEGWVDDSGESRWTLQDAIDRSVPMPALGAALNGRFYSRQRGDYSARVLAALRNQFEGHPVKTSSGP